jgi:hypothetical protein
MYHWKFATWVDQPPNLPAAVKAEPGTVKEDSKETKVDGKSHSIHRSNPHRSLPFPCQPCGSYMSRYYHMNARA